MPDPLLPPHLLLIDSYLAGECSPDERARVERWAAEAPEHRATLNAYGAMFEATRRVPRPIAYDRETDRALYSARQRIAQRAAVSMTPGAPFARVAMHANRLHGAGWRWVSAAACVLAALGVGGVVARVLVAPSPLLTAAREYRTTAGQRETLTMADGTSLTLAPDSRLTILPGYGARERVVAIDGEAYVTVMHDAAHPFRMRAGRAVMTDIGTTFDVRAYAGDVSVRLVVAEGEVDVGAGTRLRTGEMVDVDSTGRVGVVRPADVARLTGWREGRLAYREVPAATVVHDVARWYDLDIRLATPELGGQPLTAEWTNMAPDSVIAELAMLLRAQVRRNGRVVVLKAMPTQDGRR